MRKIFLSVAMLSTALSVMADKTISGVVRDDAGSPLPFASVLIEGTTIGTTTDMDGNYEIEVPEGKTLVFQYTGFADRKIKVTSSTKSKQDVKLSEDSMLDELVVTGYGVQRKKDVVGSVSALNENKLKEQVSTSIDQALQGRVAGVSVSSSSGQPGQKTSVRIRGVNSLSGSSDPLYVVDGMPIGGGNSEYSASSNPLASINPADIVSMEVLKDASATAIYGSRAANGVVMVTTRKGKSGHAKLTYDGNFTVSQFTKRYDMMNLREYAEYTGDEFIQKYGRGMTVNEYLVNPSVLGEGTNWQDELFRLGLGHSHQISASGGNEKTQYSVSLGYTGQNGIIQNTDYKRINGRVNLETDLKPWLKLGMNVGVTRQTKTSAANILDLSANSASCYTFREAEESVIMQCLLQLPLDSPYGVDGVTPWGPENNEGVQMNPIAMLYQSPIERTELNVLGTTFLDIKLFDLKKDEDDKRNNRLNWRNEFGIDLTNANDELFYPSYNYGSLYRTQDEAYQLEGTYRNNSIRFSSYLTWLKDFNMRNHLNFMAGMELNKYTYAGEVWKNKGFQMNDPRVANMSASQTINTSYKGAGSMASWFGRANYNFDDRYLVTVTGRFDGSSNFAPGNRWGFFPSLGFAWRVENEEFMKNRSDEAKDRVSSFKVRAGIGQTGNANCQPAHNQYIGAWPTDGQYGYQVYVPSKYTNPDLTWETNTQANLAVDMGFLKGRLNVSLDGYFKKNRDLLLEQELPLYVAQNDYRYIGAAYVNAGAIRNIGMDLSVSARCIEKRYETTGKTFSWDSELTFSLVRSKVLDLGPTCPQIWDKSDSRGQYRMLNNGKLINRSVVDEAPGKFWGRKVMGIIQNEDQLKEYVARTGIQAEVGAFMLSDEETWIGDPNPDFTAGWSNTFSYGPWSLSVSFNGSYGNDVYNLVRMKLAAANGYTIWYNQLADVMNFTRVGEVDGKKVVTNKADLPVPSKANMNGTEYVSDEYVEDGSYLRLQNVALSYRFDKNVTDKLHISDLHMSLGCSNVCTITGYSGYDPENPGSAIRQGVDEGRYPTPRTYSFGLGFNF